MKRIWTLLMMIPVLASPVRAEKASARVRVLPAPPSLSATVAFGEPSGNRMLDAEETGALVVTVVNGGAGDAFDVEVVLTPSRKLEGLRYDGRVALGTISAGKSVRREVPLRATAALPASDLAFDVAVREANGFDADPLRIAFKTKAFEPPDLIVADMGIEDQSGNSRVEPMENVELTVRVQNMGRGDARGVTVDVVNGRNVFIGGEAKTHFEIGTLGAGEYHDVSFMFYTNRRIENGGRIPIDVKIGEARPQFTSSVGLDLTMNARQKATDEIVVTGKKSPKGPIEAATGLSVDVDTETPEGKSRAGRYDVAVVIGNRRYSAPGVPEVAYADRDARIMKEYLLRTFGFREENILYEENATLSKFNEIFGTTANPDGMLHDWIKTGQSRVFVYYAGHGAPDLESQEAYFVPSDANPQYLATGGYLLRTFYENLARLDARDITVVLDACFSGNANGEFLFQGISPVGVKVKDDIAALGGGNILSGGAVDQVTTWYPEKRHSLFTYFFLKGIGGAADADGDRRITMGEMRAYLDENVPYMARRLKGLDQTPVVRGPDDAELVRLK